MSNSTTRRDLLRAAGASAFAAQLAKTQPAGKTPNKTMSGVPFETRDMIRMGLIGAGQRGGITMLRQWVAVDNLRVTAVCDNVKDKALAAQAVVERAGKNTPAVYANGEHDFENLVKRDDVDFVYIAAPWHVHVPAAVAAMEHGKHVLVEVPAATTIEDCWKLVDTSERTRKHCMIAENACFGDIQLMVLNMVRDGLFGNLLHGECAYDHDLRSLLFSDKSEGLWRREPHTERNGNLYPTHGLGPVAHYMDINRGDRFDYLVSMSSPQHGLDEYREAHIPKDSPKWKEKYICGDVNTSLIKTANGLTITLTHDVTTPRPYSMVNSITGSKGLFRDYPPRIYLDGMKPEQYKTMDDFKDKYTHPMWKAQRELAVKMSGGTHGGVDFLMISRLLDSMTKGLAPDIDVYDAAAWSAPGPLSEASVKQGSMPMKFPDFTRGQWKSKRPTMA